MHDSFSRAYHFLRVITIALLCAGCTRSTIVNRETRPPRQSSSYQAGSQTASSPATFDGRVVSIEDGDTIIILDDANRTYKIRLQGIDAPEGRQAFGDGSRQNLSDLVFEKQVQVESSKRDRYGRIVAKVVLDGDDICLQQIKAGMAWHYKHYQGEQSAVDRELYATAEDEARAKRLGLWRDDHPLPPWQFRRYH